MRNSLQRKEIRADEGQGDIHTMVDVGVYRLRQGIWGMLVVSLATF